MGATMDNVRVSRGGGKPAEASPRQALALIADKWAVLVITTLAAGSWRYNALRRELGGISQKMLTQTLRSLEQRQLVVRRDFREIPPRVEYELTRLGKSLAGAITVLDDWVSHNYHRTVSPKEGASTSRHKTPTARSTSARGTPR